jgi:hypothetical protein
VICTSSVFGQAVLELNLVIPPIISQPASHSARIRQLLLLPTLAGLQRAFKLTHPIENTRHLLYY